MSSKDTNTILSFSDLPSLRDSEISPAEHLKAIERLEAATKAYKEGLLSDDDEGKKLLDAFLSFSSLTNEKKRLLLEIDDPANETASSSASRLRHRKKLQPTENAASVEVQPKGKPMPRNLSNFSIQEIASLPIKEFVKAARRTKDPRQLVLGFNVNNQAEEALQLGLRQYLKDVHGVEPKGKIRLNVIIHKYESVKKGTTAYRGYMQASYDDNRGTTLYRLTEEELAEELRRRQVTHSTEPRPLLTK